MHAIALRGCADTVRESALKVDSRRKIPCGSGESNLGLQHLSPVLCQLSYIPIPRSCDAVYKIGTAFMLMHLTCNLSQAQKQYKATQRATLLIQCYARGWKVSDRSTFASLFFSPHHVQSSLFHFGGVSS